MKIYPQLIGFVATVCFAVFSANCSALTTTYTFSSPPDNVSVTTTPGNSTISSWPAQLLNTRVATENNTGVVFRNEANNTVFVDDNALLVSNSSVLIGDFVWADVQYNGPTDEPYIEIDFTNWIGGIVEELQFDFAFTLDLSVSGAIVFDSQGDRQTLGTPTSSFIFGEGQTGSQGSATLIPTGILDDIARVRFEFADENFDGLQIGFDNLVINSGQSADFTDNGTVDGADLIAWTTAFGNSGAADADGDGDSDGQDFLIWQNEASASSAFAAIASVPEPSTCWLCIVAIATMPRLKTLTRRRSR